MPISQSLNSPGLLPVQPKIDYGDPFASSGAVRRSSAASWITEASYLSPDRPGTPSGGLSYEQIMALSDLRQISDYSSFTKPLTIPSSLLTSGYNPANTIGGGRAVRTGSLELNMLDLGATIRMASGSFLGQESPMFGVAGAGGPMDDVLGALNNYNRLPSRLLDYTVGLPLAWMGFNKASVGATNPDGSKPYAFQQDNMYWNALANITTDAELDEMANIAAYATVSEAMAPALKAQLLEIFKRDQLSLTGFSSGNERTDYLAKKQYESWQENEAKRYTWNERGRVLKDQSLLGNIEAAVDLSGMLFSAFAGGAMTLLPWGTGWASTLSPVSAKAEAGWAALTPDARRGYLGQAQTAQLVSDVIVTLPLFSGIGSMLNFAKAGAAGKEFLPLITKLTSTPVGLGGERIIQESVSGNAFINVVKHAAWLAGKPGIRVPAVLTEAGPIGRLTAGRFAIDPVYHITNLYDSVLHVMKLGMADGIAMWGLNWAMKAASPQYAATYGREIDNSHWVSESSAAAAIDMMGLFTGGTMGAATLAKFTGAGVGASLSKAGLNASPFNFAYMMQYGGSGMTNLIQRLRTQPITAAELPFERHVMSVMQKWIQQGQLELAGLHPARAADIMAGANITRAESMTLLGKVIKASQERTWGIEGDAWTQTHRVARKQAQALLNDIGDLMATETGNQFWNRQLSQMKAPNGRPLAYNPEGLKEATSQFAKMLGEDGDAIVAGIESSGLFRSHMGARAKLIPWQQAANNMMQQAFNHYQGILQAVRNSGTSKSAAGLEIVRQDALYIENSRLFLAEAKAVRDGTGDAAVLEALRSHIVHTPDFSKFWARQKNWHNEGTRSLDDVSVEAVEKWLEQIDFYLPSKRALPGDDAVEGELNQLHRDLDGGGIWTLAYKATEKTAAGTERAQMLQHVAEQKAWEVGKVAAANAFEDARIARADYATDFNYAMEMKYIEPLNKKYNARLIEVQERISLLLAETKANKTVAVRKERNALIAERDAIYKKFDAAMVRRNKATQADKELNRLNDAENAARDAWKVAIDPTNMPLGYRIGPVQPDGFTADLQEAFSIADTSGVGINPNWAREIETAKLLDPTSGDSLWHVTLNWAKVQVEGLRGKGEVPDDSGMGGGNIDRGVSLSTNRKQAEMNARQMEGARAAANGEMSMEDVLLHFRQLPKMLNERGRSLYRRLNEGNDGIFSDPNGSRYESMKAADGKPRFRDYDEYKQWLQDELVQPDNYAVKYEDPAAVVESLSTYPAFQRKWDDWLDEWHAAHPMSPTWGPNGELILKTAPALSAPTALEKWQGILDILEEGSWHTGQSGVTPAYSAFVKLDQKLPAQPGGMTYILKDGSQFLGKTKGDIGIVRVSMKPEAFNAADHTQWGPDPGEIRVVSEDLFVHKPLSNQPFKDPLEAPASQWSELGAEETFVSHVTVRDARTGELIHVTTPYLDYPWQESLVQLGNRNFLARQFDNVTAGYRTWRTTEYMKAQTYRLFTTKYEVAPEQIDALIGEVMRMGYENWGPSGAGFKSPLGVPLGYQAAANMRRMDVENAAGLIFGRVRHPITHEWVNAPVKNKITGEMEVPEYAKMLVEGFRQAWTQNFTAALTSKLYTLGSMGFGSQMMGQWLAPLLRYTLSPLFKTSELVESAQLNLMRGTHMVDPKLRMQYAAAGMPIKLGQIQSELGAGDMMAQGLMGGLATAEESVRLHPNGLADLPDLPYGFGLVQDLQLIAKKRSTNSRLPGWMRDGWDNIKNPTIFKDPLAADLSVKVVRDELPLIMQKTNPTAYKWYGTELKVPDSKIADFIVTDRYLYQGWLDGDVAFSELVAHQAKFNPAMAERTTAETTAFYSSEGWAATEAMFRISARAAQSDAFGVHYFGAYRSSLERSLNHPLLGVYPLSWAYKTAKEWYKFLFDNRVFGNGELRLGATPAAYIQSTMQGQAVAWAQNSNESLDEWLQSGPLGNAFFMFNLLMPGDWANLPFPASRSIRLILREGNLNPFDHVGQNLFGPRNQYGMGAIRDVNLIRLGINDAITELSKSDTGDWSKLVDTLNRNGAPPPFDWDKVTKYPRQTLTRPLNAP